MPFAPLKAGLNVEDFIESFSILNMALAWLEEPIDAREHSNKKAQKDCRRILA